MAEAIITVETADGPKKLRIKGRIDQSTVASVRDRVQAQFGAPSKGTLVSRVGPFLKEEGPALAVRTVPPLAGALLGSLVGPVGTALGGAAGGALGEFAAQKMEVGSGRRKDTSLPQVLLQGGLSAIPAMPIGKAVSLPARLAIRALEGGTIAGASRAGTDYFEGRPIEAKNVLPAVLFGGALGAPFGFINPAKAKLPQKEPGVSNLPDLTPQTGAAFDKAALRNQGIEAALKKKGLKLPADRGEFRLQKLYLRELKKAGVEPNYVPRSFVSGKLTQPGTAINRGTQYLDRSTLFNKMEAESGEPLMSGPAGFTKIVEQSFANDYLKEELFNKIKFPEIRAGVTKLRKMGLSDKDIMYLAHYYRSNGPGTPAVFDPSALTQGKFSIEAFNPEGFTSDQLKGADAIMKRLREQVFDPLWQEAGKINPNKNLGYIKGYIAYRDKVPSATGASYRSTTSPSITRHRLSNTANGAELEDDVEKLVRGYVNATSRARTLGRLVPELTKQELRLRARGMNREATELLDTFRQATGIKDPKEMSVLVGDSLIKSNPKLYEQLVTDLDAKDPAIAADLYHTMKNLMYKSFLGLNPKNLLAQGAQPWLVGGQDIGLRRVTASLIASPTEKAMAERLLQRVRSSQFTLPELLSTPAHRRGFRIAERVLGFPGEPGMKLMDVFDKFGRRRMLIAGYRYFKQNPEKALAQLSKETDVSAIRRMASASAEDAAQEYAVALTRQTMDLMTPLNVPPALQKGIGQEIPFTSFFRSRLNREIEDFRQRRFRNMGKRYFRGAIYSAIMAGLWGTLTGDPDEAAEAFRYFHPQLSLVGASPRISPHVFNTIDAAKQDRSIPKALGRQIPLTNAIIKTKKLMEDE